MPRRIGTPHLATLWRCIRGSKILIIGERAKARLGVATVIVLVVFGLVLAPFLLALQLPTVPRAPSGSLSK